VLAASVLFLLKIVDNLKLAFLPLSNKMTSGEKLMDSKLIFCTKIDQRIYTTNIEFIRYACFKIVDNHDLIPE